jgi:hypothetical protein
MITANGNFNEHIRVKLTEYGKGILRKNWLDLVQSNPKLVETIPYRAPKVDKAGYSVFQIWSFMETFGKYMGLCMTPVVEMDFKIDIRVLKDEDDVFVGEKLS